MTSKERPLVHIQTPEEIAAFSLHLLELKRTLEECVTAGVKGLVAKPILFMIGQGDMTRRLLPAEKEELRALHAMVTTPGEWEKLNAYQKLDVQKRASALIERFGATMTLNFRA